jgi:TolB-like protein/Tfp pilus assembly protein PilF
MANSAPHASGSGAVFLSYSREDTEAAGRIAAALGSQGVEVWFDQSELRGGDAWDQKIRRQIKDCALFVPLISASTRERREGYFRLEWKLAVERTHLMAEGVPFLVPVVVDETPENAGMVPEPFLRVQWTRLPGALVTPQFIGQIKLLLNAPSPSVTAPEAARPRPAQRDGAAAPGKRAPAIPGWMWGVLAAVLGGVVLGIFTLRQPEPASAPKALSPVPSPQPTAPAVDAKSIAVLPFENMSEDKDNNAFFADGIHEDLLTNLALIPELKVISRTSVMQYRGTTKTTRQIGAELGVAYVLEGSVRRAGNKVRVTGQLINTRTDEHVWARSYDRDLTDVFAIQAALSQEIAGALSAAISPQTQKFITRRPTENPAAYDMYLKARDVANRSPISSVPALREQEALFKNAVQLDPNFAAAWGELARVHALFVFWGIDGSPARLAEADAAIAQAVRIAPDSPEVIEALGTYAYYAYRDYARATEQYEKLAKLQPNNPSVYSSLGLIERRQGRWAESLAHFRRAVELDPANIAIQRNLLQIASMGRHWDEARAGHQRLIALMPDQLREQLDAADGEFIATGSLAAVDALLARLTPAQRESPIALFFRKNWAINRGDTAEFKRLDQLQPSLESEFPVVYSDLAAAQVYFAAGDLATARARQAASYTEWRARLASEPTNAIATATVGQMEAALGHAEEAVRLSRKAVELVPESRDAVDGPYYRYDLATVYAMNGDKDQAIAELSHVLLTPTTNNSVAQIRTDPAFAKLRGDPRFEALLNDPKNNAPLF